MADLMAGNITPEEEQKLQQAWIHILRLSGGIKDLDKEESLKSVPDLTNQLQKQLGNQSPEDFHTGFWGSILLEHPDALVLRFLRARKLDVPKAMEMLVSAVNWRMEQNIREIIIRTGEAIGMKTDPTEDDKGFMAQYRCGKSFVHGRDLKDRIIYIIRAQLHDPQAQSNKAIESYILHNIESIRLFIKSAEDKCCLIFDMTGFGLKNMDYHVIQFLVSIFEARYPETLGVVLVHNAPFVFWGIWNIVKGWLDPVIASKVNFTRKQADLLQFIAEENLQTVYGGKDMWEYEYLEPQADENARLDDADKRTEIETERSALVHEFEANTVKWAEDDRDAATKRSDIAARLEANYRRLDPYIRSRTILHRMGLLVVE
ncbi:CRAL/TRIO domain-containing protein [Xylaria nigripes]|nr:CRAL/TRIO domain-containing protein [Xylaria nigripes]